MRKILSLLIILILVFLGAVAIFQWDNFRDGKILPPNITLENCDPAIAEIEKYDWDEETAIAIMKAESKCDANSKGDTDLVYSENNREYGYSVGLFQIRILPEREDCDTFDIATNVKCAYDIYSSDGNSWEAWSRYNDGEYRNYMWRTIW